MTPYSAYINIFFNFNPLVNIYIYYFIIFLIYKLNSYKVIPHILDFLTVTVSLNAKATKRMFIFNSNKIIQINISL